MQDAWVAFARSGDLYFTDQGQTGVHDPTGRVYRYTADGRLECLIGNGPSPNGLVLDPADHVLYVAMTRANCMWHCPLKPGGGVAKVGVFAQLPGIHGPDGLAMDERGNLAAAHDAARRSGLELLACRLRLQQAVESGHLVRNGFPCFFRRQLLDRPGHRCRGRRRRT